MQGAYDEPMSAPTVLLLLADAVTPVELRELIQELGGEADPEMGADARLSRGWDHIWVYGPEYEKVEDPEEDLEVERLLGGPIAAEISLNPSNSSGSPRLALEIIEAAAARGWRFVVDNGDDILTLDTVRDRAARFSSVFWEWDWGRR